MSEGKQMEILLLARKFFGCFPLKKASFKLEYEFRNLQPLI